MKNIRMKIIPLLCIVMTLTAFMVYLWINSQIAVQSEGIIYPKVYFEGEYKIGEKEWKVYRQGDHIPANQGDVFLKGRLKMRLEKQNIDVGEVKSGSRIALYCDHIMVKIQEKGYNPFDLGMETMRYEITCAKQWGGYIWQGEESEVEISIHNPHKFGNRNAVDEMLENMYIYAGYDFEEDRIQEGSVQRVMGMVTLLCACGILGIAAFAERIKVRENHFFWLIAFLMFFAGGSIFLDSPNINLWKPSYIFNTSVLGICMMMYQYLVTLLVTYVLGRKTLKYMRLIVYISGLLPVTLLIISVSDNIHFYGTWGVWAALESLISLLLLFCVLFDLKEMEYKKGLLRLAAAAPLVSFICDVIATALGWWQGGRLSFFVFYVLVLVAAVIVIRIIPEKINEAARAKELEEKQRELQQELKNRRVSVVMSQIRTHFIFNVMTIISGLCNSDPKKADDALILFARYLRKNMSVMDRDEPILFSQELHHVEEYISLEKMRFGDKIQFEKDLEFTDFKLPPLTIQPLVENSIKHGLLASGKKGTVTLKTYECEEEIWIIIEDDGAGFCPQDLEKEEAIGIRNVRYRVENMIGGTLEVTSKYGQGTTACIKIPSEYRTGNSEKNFKK